MAITAGLGALLGAKNSSLSNRTTTSTAAPSYTPAQMNLQTDLGSTLDTALSNPLGTPAGSQGIDAINKSTTGLGDSMNRYLASRGFTNSGTSGYNQQQIQSQRVGQIGNLSSSLYSSTLPQALNFAFENPTRTTTTVAPGNTGAGALSGGVTSLIQALNQGMAANGNQQSGG